MQKAHKNILSPIGAWNIANEERQAEDYYATPPEITEMLLDRELFNRKVWECACGGGHIAEVLKGRGYEVKATDLIDRGYGQGGVDFLKQTEPWEGDIITNPPYALAEAFIRHSLELIPFGSKVAMLLKLQYLEGKKRRRLFNEAPPKVVYVSTDRIKCAKGGDFDNNTERSAIAYAWFVWEKGFRGDPILRWFN